MDKKNIKKEGKPCFDMECYYTLLADILATKHGMYGVHWHVKGQGFLEIHEFSEAIYTHLIDRYDTIAERIIAMGHSIPIKPVDQLAKKTVQPIDHTFLNIRDGWQVIKHYLRALKKTALCAKRCAEKQNDLITGAILDEDIMSIDKFLWIAKHSCPCNDLESYAEEQVLKIRKEIEKNCCKDGKCKKD